MRLMGIGTTTEARADMLLCPSLMRDNAAVGDVLVTNPLQGSPHILTIDYLLHRHPCLLCPAWQRLFLDMPAWEVASTRPSFEFHANPRLVGGAPSVVMTVGGAELQIVIDTGAAAALSLSPTAISKLKVCGNMGDGPLKAMQTGVNGEKICSDIVTASVQIGSTVFPSVQIFANSEDVQGADGYAGMGLLRALDLWLAPHEIGFRPSGLPPGMSRAMTPGTCGKRPLQCAVSEHAV